MKIIAKKSERGLAIIAVVGIMVVLGLLGIAVARLVGTGHVIKTDYALYERASMIAQAGIEYGVKKIYEAQSPVVVEPGVSFSGGTFVISQAGRTLTVAGRLGEVSVTRLVDSPTQADCTRIDVSSVQVTGGDDKLSGIQIRKICLVQVVIDKVTFSWTPDNAEKIKKIKIESSTVYNNPSGDVSGTLLDVTNYVMNNDNQNNMNSVEFNHEIEDKTFVMELTFGDGTTRAVTFSPDDD